MGKKSNDLVRIRQTCCLGLPSEIAIPQILKEMHQLIACDHMQFAWTDELGNIVNAYFEKPDPGALDYLRSNQSKFEQEAGISVRQAILFGKTTGNYRWPMRAGFEQTESYARLFAALNIHFTIDGVVRDRDRPLGQVVLWRLKGDADFSVEEEQTLAQTLPYLAHALASPHKTPQAFVETGDTGLLVFDAHGRLTYQSARAQELCFYALHDEVPVGQDKGVCLKDIEDRLGALFAQIARVQERAGILAPPPAWVLKNGWGEFRLRAYVLEQSKGVPCSFGVVVERKVPLEMRMLERVKEMPLSNKQREVCFLLLRGVETDCIAQMLGITRTTLKEHTQAIYRRLNVSKREELIRHMLG